MVGGEEVTEFWALHVFYCTFTGAVADWVPYKCSYFFSNRKDPKPPIRPFSFGFYIRLILQVEKRCVNERYLLFDNIRFYEVVKKKGEVPQSSLDTHSNHTPFSISSRYGMASKIHIEVIALGIPKQCRECWPGFRQSSSPLEHCKGGSGTTTTRYFSCRFLNGSVG